MIEEDVDLEAVIERELSNPKLKKNLRKLMKRLLRMDSKRTEQDWLSLTILEAMEAWFDDPSNLMQGEIVSYPFDDNESGYKIERKFQAIYKRHARNPDQYEKYKFKKMVIGDNLIVSREFND